MIKKTIFDFAFSAGVRGRTGGRQAAVRRLVRPVRLLIGSGLVMLLFSSFSCRQHDPDELLHKAAVSASAGDWSYAQGYAQRAVARDPRNLEGQLLLGLTHYYLGELAKATGILRQAANRAPDDFRAQYLYGWILSENRKYTEALEPLRRALELDHNHYELLGLLARACLEQNLIEGVRYLQLLMAQPEFDDRLEAFNAIALLWMGEPDYQRADFFFRQALRQDAGNPIILQNLAVLHDIYLNDEAKALDYYRRCLVASQQLNDQRRAEAITGRLRQMARHRSNQP